ncbi:MAG: ABC transporter permease [Actinomycetota bacterium]|nr:ABC transporter permease [Actinomycetota bacterium]
MTISTRPKVTTQSRSGIYWVVSDAMAMTKRNLLRYIRIPELLVFSTIQPVMFILLFAYVFGGAIRTPGVNYIQFLIPGILVQTVVFGSTATGIGLADDLGKGMVDRFRSLPMARSAVLAGRTISDTIRNSFVVGLMIAIGSMIGFRFRAGFIPALAGVALVVLFGLAFSWISATIGLAIGDAEAAQTASFIWLFPLTFASSVFVPTASMPHWLQVFAKVNPVTNVVNAMRALSLGGPTSDSLWKAIAWIAAILVVFVPMAVRNYRRVG